jgi:DNA-binding winged helix-turn-helix (wHTH) protein
MTPVAECLCFGAFEFNPETAELFRAGARVALRPQPGKVLALLSTRPGELVTREDLCRGIWGEAVHVDYDQALENALWEIRRALGDVPKASRYVETVAKRGYRFVAPVTRVEHPVPCVGAHAPRAIAVMPFVSLSGVVEHQSLADELTDELITCLARESGLQVVSRTSVLPFRGAAGRLAEIARAS